MSAFYLKVWRKDAGSLYDLVGTSGNLVASLVPAGIATIDLSSVISGVQEGDYIGYRIETSATGCGAGQFYALTGQAGVTSYYVTDATPSSTDYNWAGQTAAAGAVLPIELYMQAPQVVGIGDSIMSGAPNHRAYLVDSPPLPDSNPPTTILGNLKALTNYTYQNMGIGSQTSTNIAARFANDVIASKPRAVIIEAGVNDISGGGLKATFLANWTTMLNAAQAESSVSTIIVLKILPWSNGTTVQMQTRDDWNNSLVTLAASYPKAVVTDASSYVGQFRAGGDPGNLWDIQAAYNADGVHFNPAGHAQIAQAIVDTLDDIPVDLNNPILSGLSPADNSAGVMLNSNLIINFDEAVFPQAGAQNDIVIKKSIDDSTVETIDAESAQVTGAGTAAITVNPTDDFAISTNYYVQIGADTFDDISDNSFAGIADTTTWNFRTISNIVNGFAYRKQITVDNANIDATLTDFPVYVRISGDSDIGAAARNDGHDIRFTSPDSLQFLSYQRESWSGGGGSAASGDFWVKTTLNLDNNPATDDTIYLYYGKADALDGQDTSDGINDVWNPAYAGVWHLDEDVVDEGTQVGAHHDFTSFAHHGTQNGNVETPAKVSYGQDFDGIDDNIAISSSYSSQDITASWWSNCAIANPTAEGIFDIYRGASNDRLFGYHWDFSGHNGLYIIYYDASTTTYYNRLLDSSITQADWHYYSAVWVEAAKTFTLYKDGIAQSTNAGGSPTAPGGASTKLGVGHSASPGDVNIDEFRISSSARPSDWLKFEYFNMGEGDHELNWGGQSAMDLTAPTINSISSDRINGSYNAGNTIDIDVNFSESVTSVEDITVTLETGAIDRTCAFSVSNSATASCDYMVQSGDTSPDLDVSAIAGIIEDQSGNVLTNFVPGTNLAGSKDLVVDTTNPVVAEVVPVPDPTDDDTPNYTFSSTEAGLITYGGDCVSSDTSAGVGANLITFDTPLTEALHDNCTITVTDTATNVSNLLAVSPFTVDLSDSDPPTDFNLRSPIHNSWSRDTTPTFRWYASTDIDSGLAGYRLYIDSHLKRSVGSTTLSATFQVPLSQGSHSWYVIARDNEGNTKQSLTTRTVRVDSVRPYLGIISPNATNFWTYGEYIPIKGMVTDKTSHVRALRIYNHTLNKRYDAAVSHSYFRRWIRLRMGYLNNITVAAYDRAGNRTKRYLNIYQIPSWTSSYNYWY